MKKNKFNNFFKNKSVLITGGTGSFGKALVNILYNIKNIKKIIIFSRDEFKQDIMQKKYNSKVMRYFLGDVRDAERLAYALKEVNYVFHAAALKQVPAAEYNPEEVIKTNILGTNNVIMASLKNGVDKFVNLSTDKACSPINLYGATKLVSDKLTASANLFKGKNKTVFCSVRYGNIINSRGSIIPILIENIKNNQNFSLTHKNATRFLLRLDDGVKFVINSLIKSKGGEIFIPKLKSIKILELMKAFDVNRKINIIGLRPGEKIHESLFSFEDSRNVKSFKNYFIIYPSFTNMKNIKEGKFIKQFEYSSLTAEKIKSTELKKLIKS